LAAELMRLTIFKFTKPLSKIHRS